jgi:tRNA(Phe) wybutosine-synthesizing methylase Tyw3
MTHEKSDPSDLRPEQAAGALKEIGEWLAKNHARPAQTKPMTEQEKQQLREQLDSALLRLGGQALWQIIEATITHRRKP